MKALLANGSGSATIGEFEDPPVRDSFIKIKVHAIALNPTDAKHVHGYTKGGEIVGIDVTGTVEAIGSNVKSPVKIGDRVSGMCHGCNSYSPRDGGFAEHAELKDGILAWLPDDWDWTRGATLGAGVTTAGQGLFDSLGLPLPGSAPTSPQTPVLIYGGSTATGCLAIQFAALAGLKVITLASPHQFERLKALGASVCYDYHHDDVGAEIRRDTGDGLMHAFDIISSEGSMKICADALASKEKDGQKPKVSLLLPGKTFPRDDVDVNMTSGYDVFGEKCIKYGNVVDAVPAQYEFGKKFWALTNDLIHAGKLKTHDVEVREGGLSGVMAGLEDLLNHRVKGAKLVYML